MKNPPTLSKKDLCVIFDLVSANGACNYVKLRTHFITDSILQELGMSEEAYRFVRIFTRTQSKKLIKLLELEVEELDKLYS